MKHNRRQQEIQTLRTEINDVTKQYKRANEEEKEGLNELRSILRERRNNLQRAERIRKARRERGKKRAMFVANPYKFTKATLDGTKAGLVKSTTEKLEKHLSETHSDERQWEHLGNCDRIENVPEPEIPMNTKEPSLKEVSDVVKKARSASSPGPNGIPFKVYKKCPNFETPVEATESSCEEREDIIMLAESRGVFYSKRRNVGGHHTISDNFPPKCRRKIFFSIMARRMTSYMTDNNYVDTSVQKGGIPGFSRCIEHTSIISKLIQEAKVNKKDLTVVWLDLANAYGTVPHMLIQQSLDH
ncbi:uncharacterized protein LOC134722855 [Mytilus trossulus]|uniref:uncharacterized protein LOC134722855 n=1 Tax=Mytilus trossulus TaxID=6551 RepID=UPI0030075B85